MTDIRKVRFYTKIVPDIDDLVMVRIQDKTEYGYNVELVEYNNMKGLLPLNEIHKRRKGTRKKRIIKPGENIIVTVLNSDKNKLFVDVSIKRNKDEYLEKFQTDFLFHKKINKIGVELFKAYMKYTTVSNIEPLDIKQLMTTTIWKLYNKYYNEDEFNPHEIYTKILINPSCLLDDSGLDIQFIDFYKNNILSRVTKKDMEMGIDIMCVSLCHEGINTLKYVLDISDFNTEKGYLVNISIISSSKYKITIKGLNENICREILNNLVNYIKSRIGDNNVKFNILNNIYAIKENTVDIKFLSDNKIDDFTF